MSPVRAATDSLFHGIVAPGEQAALSGDFGASAEDLDSARRNEEQRHSRAVRDATTDLRVGGSSGRKFVAKLAVTEPATEEEVKDLAPACPVAANPSLGSRCRRASPWWGPPVPAVARFGVCGSGVCASVCGWGL